MNKLLALLCLSIGATAAIDEATYVANLKAALATIEAGAIQKPLPRIAFGCHHLFSNLNFWAAYKNPTLWTQEAQVLIDSGCSRISINVPGEPFYSNNATEIGYYVTLVNYIKAAGKNVTVRVSTGGLTSCVITSFATWQTCADTIADRVDENLTPDVLSLIHEPLLQNSRLRAMGCTDCDGVIEATPADWNGYLNVLAATVNANPDPDPQYATAFVANEGAYNTVMSANANISRVGLDIYDSAYQVNHNLMNAVAQANGKITYISETWREAWCNTPPGCEIYEALGLSNEGLGYSHWPPLDELWVRTFSLWASSKGMTEINVFWTWPFHYIAQDGEDNHGMDSAYIARVAANITAQTGTALAFKQLSLWFKVLVGGGAVFSGGAVVQ